MNWINYFEKYSADCKLLSSIEGEIYRLERDGRSSPRLSSLRDSAKLLRETISKVDSLLDGYVSESATPREAYRLSQEQLYLNLRYRQNKTIEETAEAMCVSRDTAYRIRRRIICRGDIFSAAAT